jgi:hypothetical protein
MAIALRKTDAKRSGDRPQEDLAVKEIYSHEVQIFNHASCIFVAKH